MKTKLEELLQTVNTAVETLKEDAKGGSGDSPFSPQLGSALGGLRTAKAGIEAHLKLTVKVEPKPETGK